MSDAEVCPWRSSRASTLVVQTVRPSVAQVVASCVARLSVLYLRLVLQWLYWPMSTAAWFPQLGIRDATLRAKKIQLELFMEAYERQGRPIPNRLTQELRSLSRAIAANAAR